MSPLPLILLLSWYGGHPSLCLLRCTPCSPVNEVLATHQQATHIVHVIPSGANVPLIPKILRSLGYQLRSAKFWRTRIVALRNFLNTFRFPSLAALPSVESMPNLHVFTFSIIPSQLGRTDPFCVLQHDPTLIFVVKALGSVKQEGTFNLQGADW